MVTNILFLFGIVLVLVVAFIEPIGITRIILVTLSLIFLASRFILGFFRDPTKRSGSIQFFEHEIHILKAKNLLHVYKLSDISGFDYKITDYEGEVKIADMTSTSGQLRLRSGVANEILFVHQGKQYRYLFKLSTGEAKQKATKFLASLKKTIFAATLDS